MTAFLTDLCSVVFGLRSRALPWQWQEYIQTLASIGLIGVLVSAVFLRTSLRCVAQMSGQIEITSGNFKSHLTRLFAQWELSPSEQAVPVFAMKGFSNAEIAGLRGTSESTIKSQMNAIYRKTDLGIRQHLIACLVEDLLAGVALPEN